MQHEKWKNVIILGALRPPSPLGSMLDPVIMFEFMHLSALKCWWISCVCQHLKIVWESSKSDPANFGRITRHTFALHAAPNMHKCDNFRELFDPLPPSDQCWILCWWSNFCAWQHLSFQHWLGGRGFATISSPSCEVILRWCHHFSLRSSQ